jgi:hypothetical protein
MGVPEVLLGDMENMNNCQLYQRPETMLESQARVGLEPASQGFQGSRYGLQGMRVREPYSAGRRGDRKFSSCRER